VIGLLRSLVKFEGRQNAITVIKRNPRSEAEIVAIVMLQGTVTEAFLVSPATLTDESNDAMTHTGARNDIMNDSPLLYPVRW